jgi:hypothetical protein
MLLHAQYLVKSSKCEKEKKKCNAVGRKMIYTCVQECLLLTYT